MRDRTGAIKIVTSGSAEKGGTHTAILPDDLAPGWFGVRINNLTNIDDGISGDLIPIYIDIYDFNIPYVQVKRSIRKALASFDQTASCNIHNTSINDWFIESHAGGKNIRKFSDGADAEPVSRAFFAFRHQDSTLFIGRMLDFEVIQILTRPPDHPTKPNHNQISRTKWIVNKKKNDGHQVLDVKDKHTCFGCHENGAVKPASFSPAGTSNICHRCHVGASGYTNGLYDPSQ